MKIRETIKLIEAEGWFLVVMKNEVRQYKHPSLKGRITLAGKLGEELSTAAQAILAIQRLPKGR